MLEAKEISRKNIVKEVSINIRKGEFVSIMGPSGSGKSTLLYMLSLIDCLDEGSVSFMGKEVSRLKEEEKAHIRREKMGFVFQNSELLPELNVVENVLLPIKKNRKDYKAKAIELLESLGLKGFEEKKVNNLSGGERQRVAIARALINDPEIIFADEPTGALNQKSAMETMVLFSRLNAKGETILMVTHDAKMAFHASRILFLVDGRIKDTFDNSKKDPSLLEEFLKRNNW